MQKKSLSWMFLYVLMIAGLVFVINPLYAQETRSIVPYPRDDLTIETVDPVSKMPKSSFCIGINAIDIKLTNNSNYRRYVYVINRDTRGLERTLYSGWLEPGSHYLTTLMGTQFQLVGPAGTEMLRVDTSDYGKISAGRWVTFYVQDCGGGYPPGGGQGYASVWARVYPYAIPQGGKGTITLQTNVASGSQATYYFEILNSWDQLWKRLPANKQPYERYEITLPVGTKTKPAMLTYTVKLWLEGGFRGERQNIASTQFSFRVVEPGSTPSPYEPGYPGYPSTPYNPGDPWNPNWNPYGSGIVPYSSGFPYVLPQYGSYSYGTGGQTSTQKERSIE